MHEIVFIRHGESTWNQENRFTGWTDVDLTEKGYQQAEQGGRALREKGYTFDLAYTSVLKRAIRTLWIVLDQLDLMWIPVERCWRLNERHYGALQGLNKAETAKKYGEEQVHEWRRSYSTPPPPLKEDDPRHPKSDPRYGGLADDLVPRSESLELTVKRVVPYWEDTIVPAIKAGRKIVIVAHGNSLRALVKYLDDVSDDKIVGLNIPTGIPLVYELDENIRPRKHFYLADEETLQKEISAVKNQSKAKDA